MQNYPACKELKENSQYKSKTELYLSLDKLCKPRPDTTFSVILFYLPDQLHILIIFSGTHKFYTCESPDSCNTEEREI